MYLNKYSVFGHLKFKKKGFPYTRGEVHLVLTLNTTRLSSLYNIIVGHGEIPKLPVFLIEIPNIHGVVV